VVEICEESLLGDRERLLTLQEKRKMLAIETAGGDSQHRLKHVPLSDQLAETVPKKSAASFALVLLNVV
jgi:hypothetical protein